MTVGSRGLEGAYERALEGYLGGGGEEDLARAYDVGRQALVDGIPMMALVQMHHEALRRVGGVAAENIDRAGEILMQLLSPFEMTHSGFKDANARLRTLNDELTEKNRQLKDTKRATDRANRELEAFSYSVAHDLRAPLRGISGFGQALVEDYGQALPPEAQRFVQRIREATAQMAQLIDDLLRLSRLGRGVVHRTTVDVSALAEDIVSELRSDDPERVVDVHIAGGMRAEADAQLLRIALQNLLGNAWKFTEQTAVARIDFSVAEHEGRTVFTVTDNGAGFDPRYATRLFAPFQRLHSVRDFEGTGIGLALVHRVIQRHGGEVWAEAAVDKGASFHFTLLPSASSRDDDPQRDMPTPGGAG